MAAARSGGGAAARFASRVLERVDCGRRAQWRGGGGAAAVEAAVRRWRGMRAAAAAAPHPAERVAELRAARWPDGACGAGGAGGGAEGGAGCAAPCGRAPRAPPATLQRLRPPHAEAASLDVLRTRRFLAERGRRDVFECTEGKACRDAEGAVGLAAAGLAAAGGCGASGAAGGCAQHALRRLRRRDRRLTPAAVRALLRRTPAAAGGGGAAPAPAGCPLQGRPSWPPLPAAAAALGDTAEALGAAGFSLRMPPLPAAAAPPVPAAAAPPAGSPTASTTAGGGSSSEPTFVRPRPRPGPPLPRLRARAPRPPGLADPGERAAREATHRLPRRGPGLRGCPEIFSARPAVGGGAPAPAPAPARGCAPAAGAAGGAGGGAAPSLALPRLLNGA